ncbi:hypothetical protein RUND412_001899 [Rhizina undulata]
MTFFTPNVVHRFFVSFICITLIAVILRYCWFDAQDPFKCGALLNGGEWLDQPPLDSDNIPTKWQPPGCITRKYTTQDISSCFQKRRAVFVGDSTIRQIFWATAQALDKTADPSKIEKHVDILFEREGVTLEFIWDPFLNSSRLQAELSSYHDGKKEFKEGEAEENPISLMLMGTGLWYARHENVNGFKKWKDAIDNVVVHMRATRKDLSKSDLMLLSPVLVPAWKHLNADRKQTIKPQEISAMNQYLNQLSSLGLDVVWSFNKMTYNLPQNLESSGIHVVESIAEKQADILLNMRCNSQLPQKYPYDKTCCSRYQPPNYQQWFGLVFVLAVLPLLSYMRSRSSEIHSKTSKSPWIPSDPVGHALLVFGLAVVYCFYADRTQVFNKAFKNYGSMDFILLTILAGAFGIFTIRHSSPTGVDQSFLSRGQTEEWKGWMQFIILIYHYTGASKIAGIYGFIRITVAAYLFMTGYGHTVFFYSKKDYSFKRVASVLVRLNMLSLVLPYMMRTDYLFYYFAPLVSFWFLVVWGTMRVGAKYNSNTRFLFAKIILSAAFVTALMKFSGILETIFHAFGLLAKTQWDVKEWRFRVFLDMWIVYVGMVIAILALKIKETSFSNQPSWRFWKRLTVIISIVSLPLYFHFQTTRENKFVYNAYHPYISWIPILSFIVLRNATSRLRNFHSRGFAWLGRCSLETFTLQFHVWMAADTHGLLDLGVFGNHNRVLNLIVATLVFFYVSHCVSEETGVLTTWVLEAGKKSLPSTLRGSSLPLTNMDMTAATKNRKVEETGLEGQLAEQAAAGETKMEVGRKSKLCLYWGNLKLRIGVILVGMWIMNLTYR